VVFVAGESAADQVEPLALIVDRAALLSSVVVRKICPRDRLDLRLSDDIEVLNVDCAAPEAGVAPVESAPPNTKRAVQEIDERYLIKIIPLVDHVRVKQFESGVG
jgi:hypothetical protein